jgi:hypothetical protein
MTDQAQEPLSRSGSQNARAHAARAAGDDYPGRRRDTGRDVRIRRPVVGLITDGAERRAGASARVRGRPRPALVPHLAPGGSRSRRGGRYSRRAYGGGGGGGPNPRGARLHLTTPERSAAAADKTSSLRRPAPPAGHCSLGRDGAVTRHVATALCTTTSLRHLRSGDRRGRAVGSGTTTWPARHRERDPAEGRCDARIRLTAGAVSVALEALRHPEMHWTVVDP